MSLGWTANELFKEEYVEECSVSNIDSLDPESTNKEIAETFTIDDLWTFIEDAEEEDDGFGVASVSGGKKKKKAVIKRQTMDFKLFMKMSGDACTSKTRNCAPVIHYEKVNQEKVVKIPLNIDGLAMAANDMKIVDVMELLKGCVQRQVHILGMRSGSLLHAICSNETQYIFVRNTAAVYLKSTKKISRFHVIKLCSSCRVMSKCDVKTSF